MNILVFAHDSYLYGASQSLLTALKGIRKMENRNVLVLLPFAGSMEEELRSSEIDFKVVPFPRCVAFSSEPESLFQRLKNRFSYIKKMNYILPGLKEIAKQFKADVIYTNTSIVAAGYKVARHLNIPHVWHVREFGDLDFNLTYYPGRKKIAQLISKSEKSIFSSYALKKHWIAKDSSNQTVIYNGIFEETHEYSKSFRKFPNGVVRIGLLGAVHKGKGQHTAIKAFAELLKKKPNCHLIFYGDPADLNYFNELQKLVQSLQIEDKVFFKKFSYNKNLVYQDLDLVLNCSKMEGFGRTIVEAMEVGIPVIANGAGGILEIIDDKINGLLYDGSEENLFQIMTALLSDSNLYEYLSLNGIRKAEKYSVKEYVNSIDSILYNASVSNQSPGYKKE